MPRSYGIPLNSIPQRQKALARRLDQISPTDVTGSSLLEDVGAELSLLAIQHLTKECLTHPTALLSFPLLKIRSQRHATAPSTLLEVTVKGRDAEQGP
jgi:hypothetical protein